MVAVIAPPGIPFYLPVSAGAGWYLQDFYENPDAGAHWAYKITFGKSPKADPYNSGYLVVSRDLKSYGAHSYYQLSWANLASKKGSQYLASGQDSTMVSKGFQLLKAYLEANPPAPEVEEADTTLWEQFSTFASFHGLSAAEAWPLIFTAPFEENKKYPEPSKKAAWPKLWKYIYTSGHLTTEAVGKKDGVTCKICVAEALNSAAASTQMPAKMAHYLKFLNEDGVIGTKADTPEGSLIRQQVTFYAYYHSINRYEVSQKLEKAGAKAEYLLPYLYLAEQKAAPPSKGTLKVNHYYDILMALDAAGTGHMCLCANCNAYRVKWKKKPEASQLVLPESKAYAKVNAAKSPEGVTAHTATYTPGGLSKMPYPFASKEAFLAELSAFAAHHGMNLHQAYLTLPESWQVTLSCTFSPLSSPLLLAGWQEQSFAHIALASGCVCNLCQAHPYNVLGKAGVKKVLAKPKKKASSTVTLKKGQAGEVIKEALEGDPNVEGVPEMPSWDIKDQIAAWANHHKWMPAYAWHTIFKMPKSDCPWPEHQNVVSGVSPEQYWPDLLSKTNHCNCDGCQMSTLISANKEAEDAMKKTPTLKKTPAPAKEPEPTTTVALGAGDQIVLSTPVETTLEIPESASYTVIQKV